MKLRHILGFDAPEQPDPFLLLDGFRNNRLEDYKQGFPWHPHRNIKAIAYMLEGTVECTNNLGNQGQLRTGDVQWMTAGSGILHQEMPKGDKKAGHRPPGRPSKVDAYYKRRRAKRATQDIQQPWLRIIEGVSSTKKESKYK